MSHARHRVRPSLRHAMRGASLRVLGIGGLAGGMVGVALDLDHIVPGLSRSTHLAVMVGLAAACGVCWGIGTLFCRFHFRPVAGISGPAGRVLK